MRRFFKFVFDLLILRFLIGFVFGLIMLPFRILFWPLGFFGYRPYRHYRRQSFFW